MTKTMTKAVPFVLSIVLLAAPALAAAQDGPRPIALQDILAWKSIGPAELSPDGAWLMYRLSPLEGESEVVLRQVKGTKEHRFPIGEAPRYGGASGTGLPFYAVHVGAFKTETTAEALAQKLKGKGYEAFVQRGTAKDSSVVYRVLIGRRWESEKKRPSWQLRSVPRKR